MEAEFGVGVEVAIEFHELGQRRLGRVVHRIGGGGRGKVIAVARRVNRRPRFPAAWRLECRGDAGLSNLSRRALFAGAALLALPARARAAEDFAIDWQGGEQTSAIAASLACADRAGEERLVSDAAREFFREPVITVDLQPGTRTRAGAARRVLRARDAAGGEPGAAPRTDPSLAAAQDAGRAAESDVQRFYREAKASGLWPAGAYMLTNPSRILPFAMTASVVPHGSAARLPFRRKNVKAKAPELLRLHRQGVRPAGIERTLRPAHSAGVTSITSSFDLEARIGQHQPPAPLADALDIADHVARLIDAVAQGAVSSPRTITPMNIGRASVLV